MLAYSKAIGANTDVVTAQAFAFPKEDSNPPAGGELLVLLVAGVGEDAFAFIRKAGLESKEIFFEAENRAEAFKKTISFIESELSKLEQFCSAIGFFENETLYIQTINEFSVLLLRGEESKTELTRGLENGKLISGMLQDGDKVLFLSPPLTEAQEEESLKKLETNLLNSNLDNLEFEVENYLQQSSKPDPIAAVLVKNTLEQQLPNSPFPSKEEGRDEGSMEDGERGISGPTIPLHLEGARSKTPSSLLIFLSFLQKIQPKQISKKKLLIVAAVIGLLIFGILFFKNSPQKPTKTPAASPIPANTNVLNDFPVFLDLNLIKENFAASRFSLSLGKIAVLDNNTKSLTVITLSQKQPQILAGQLQLGDAQLISLNGDYVYVFSKDKGILKVDAGNGKVTVEVPPDGEWQRVVDIFGFANNVYLLDEFKNQIWKYIATDNGFSERNSYLREGEEADFAAARNFQIDGIIWVLKSDNTILKFVQGGKDFFQMGQFEPPLDRIKNFFVSDETENIYFLDNDNGRVVVTNKKGEYVSQYAGDKFKTADDLVVDEKEKKLYLLEGGKIYYSDLKP